MQQLQLSAFFSVFQKHKFRSAAFGYFGHMWELYAFWAFVPVMLQTYNEANLDVTFNIPLLSFLIIAIGGLACVLAGYLAQTFGTKPVASTALFLSCLCCLIFPLVFSFASEIIFVVFLLFWGMVVIADSPLFSTLVAQNATTELKGTALTIVNCIGFSITIISIQLINELRLITDSNMIFAILAVGPILGLTALKEKNTSDEK